MVEDIIRLGLVGAGQNTRQQHIPGFQKLDSVQVTGVANRTRQSAQRVAEQYNIPRVYDNWRQLLQDDSIDAVCIGTWPYMHCPITLAALESGKHVLCEARMACDAREAHAMLDFARARPDLVTQIVPSPVTFKVDNLLIELVSDGYLGTLLAVDLQAHGRDFVDTRSPLHWRHDRNLSGYNILSMGIWYEAMMRWIGPAIKVMAMTRVNVSQRFDEKGASQAVTVPDHVDILGELANGAVAHLRFSAVTGLSSGNQVRLYGSEGTIWLDQNLNVYGGRRGEDELRQIPNSVEKQYRWRVEEEFINAIRAKEPVTRTTFEVGVQYMEFTEAVARSARTGQAVALTR